MREDRTNWGVQEYSAALNCATTPHDIFELAHEINEKWPVECTAQPAAAEGAPPDAAGTRK